MTLLHWLDFIGIWLLACAALGPNAVNCLVVSSRFGAARAMWCVVGILIAAFIFQVLVFVGVGAILATIAPVFKAVKLLGCAYIFYLGIRMWRGSSLGETEMRERGRPLALFREAFLIAMSNPKSVLAYAAIFSQFIVPDEPLLPQAAVLVPTALAITFVTYSGYALLGAPVMRALQRSGWTLLFDRLAASFFMASAAAIAVREFRR